MSRQEDLDVNKSIRKVLIRHWIDLGRLSVRTSKGKAFIHGSLHRIYGMNEELTTSIVESIFTEIRRIKNLANMHVEFDNWTDAGGKWQMVERAASLDRRARGRHEGFRIESDQEPKTNP
jgi:hypothetical protein